MTQRILAAAAVVLLLAPAARADLAPLGGYVPDPAPGSFLSVLAADGAGGLYASDGDAVYRYDAGTFAPLYEGLADAAGGAAFDPASMAVSADGAYAYVASGQSGAIVEVDLAAGAARELTGAVLGGGNYGLAIDPLYGQLFVTDAWTQTLYHVDTSGAGSLTYVSNFGGAGAAGGGIGFASDGSLVVPVSKAWASASDDRFPVDLYRFSAAWLADVAAGTVAEDAGTLFASDLMVSGCGAVAVDDAGVTYLAAGDAVYAVSPGGTLSVFEGDPAPHVWYMWGYGFSGLAYDVTQDRLITGYAANYGDGFAVSAMPAAGVSPEPATLALVGLGALGALARRRRG